MNYGYPGAMPYGQGGGMTQFAPQMPAMQQGTGYGAPMQQMNQINTVAEVEQQRKRLKALGLDDTFIDDALEMKKGMFEKRDEIKQGMFEKRDEIKSQAIDAIGSGLKSAGSGIASAASSAGSGLAGLASSL